ncbi:MAG: N-acetyltransferase family protein [Planctomycetes bacterium]|nr:N-acetyltransferase family protein [Planctomycetota bacterium]
MIRRAVLADVAAITEIYNQAILTTTATFDTEPRDLEDRRRWFLDRTERYPVLVAELQGKVVGWTALSPFSDRRAYDVTAETAFYVDQAFRGQGMGRSLKRSIIEEARRIGFHSLVARVAADSAASLHLNAQFGFQMVGTLREVGHKFGRLLDVHILQRMLDKNSDCATSHSESATAQQNGTQ